MRHSSSHEQTHTHEKIQFEQTVSMEILRRWVPSIQHINRGHIFFLKNRTNDRETRSMDIGHDDRRTGFCCGFAIRIAFILHGISAIWISCLIGTTQMIATKEEEEEEKRKQTEKKTNQRQFFLGIDFRLVFTTEFTSFPSERIDFTQSNSIYPRTWLNLNLECSNKRHFLSDQLCKNGCGTHVEMGQNFASCQPKGLMAAEWEVYFNWHCNFRSLLGTVTNWEHPLTYVLRIRWSFCGC